MGDSTEQLRAELDEQRAEIAATVGEIEERVAPSNLVEKGRQRTSEAVDRGREELRRRVEKAKSSLDDAGGDALGNTSTGLASSAQPAADRVREETAKRPWPMLAGAFALGLVIGRRLR
ncbi:MAG: DUF3618 domain-containing protein [Actinomycetota bacterium]|nr:DUF3618 domain-containing protein [Actinomycetota bacterium]